MTKRDIIISVIILIVLAVIIIPILHWINIRIGDEVFMSFFTIGNFHIHLGLIGIILLIISGLLVFLLIIQGELSNIILLILFCVLLGVIAVTLDWNDVITGRVWTGVRNII